MASILADLMLRLRSNSAELQKGVEQSKKSISSLDKKTQTLSKSSNKNFKDMSKSATGAFGQITSSMGGISGATPGALGSLKALSGGAAALNVALGPIGLIIGAIALAVAALGAYFKGTIAGAEKFAQIMGFIKGVLGVLKDLFIKLGETMVWAFENPKEAIAALWDTIQTNLINRWQGLIMFFESSFEFLKNGFKALKETIKGLFNKDAKDEAQKYWDAAKKNLVETGQAAVQMATGLDKGQQTKLGEKLHAIAEEAKADGKEMAAINLAQQKLKKKDADFLEVEADLKRKIKGYNKDAENTALTIEERTIAAQKALETIAIREKAKLALAQEAYDLKVAENALNSTTLDAYIEEKKLAAELSLIKEESLERQTTALNKYNILSQQTAKEAEAKSKAASASLEKYKQEVAQQTEEGQLAALKQRLTDGLVLQEEYQGRVTAIEAKWQAERDKIKDEAREEQRAKDDEDLALKQEKQAAYVSMIMSGLDAIGSFSEIQKKKELAKYEGDEKKKAEIEKKYARRAKAIAIAKAVVGTALAVVNALQTQPFLPMGPIMAGVALAAGGAAIAQIAAQSFATGGIVGGLSKYGDNTLVRANAGEMFINKGQQANLFKMLNGGTGGGTTTFVLEGETLVAAIDRVNAKYEIY